WSSFCETKIHRFNLRKRPISHIDLEIVNSQFAALVNFCDTEIHDSLAKRHSHIDLEIVNRQFAAIVNFLRNENLPFTCEAKFTIDLFTIHIKSSVLRQSFFDLI
ncbi:hypothetical protein BOQ62_06850, partial [Chryseobacterium sp. CH21]